MLPCLIVTLWYTNISTEHNHVLIGKLTSSIAIFNSYVTFPEGTMP